jgi:uncharacterized membrane protein
MTESIRHDEVGFRIRAEQPTRVEGFVDAAFAFAVTLLVVSVGRVPESISELLQAMRGVPAFAFSFLLIVRFWWAHRLWSRRFGIEDSYSVKLSLALVFVILIYVYPLRMTAQMAFAGFSGGVLSESGRPLAVSSSNYRELYVIFAVGYTIVLAIFMLLHRHALRCADAIGLSPLERLRTRYNVLRNGAFMCVSLVSLVLSLLPLQGWQWALPGIAYMSISPLSFAIRLHEQRRVAASGLAPA